jgi:hypothetical protein
MYECVCVYVCVSVCERVSVCLKESMCVIKERVCVRVCAPNFIAAITPIVNGLRKSSFYLVLALKQIFAVTKRKNIFL